MNISKHPKRQTQTKTIDIATQSASLLSSICSSKARLLGMTVLTLIAICIVAMLFGDQTTTTEALPHPSRLPALKMAHYDFHKTGKFKSLSISQPLQSIKAWSTHTLKSYKLKRSSILGMGRATKTIRNALSGFVNRMSTANRRVGNFIKARTAAVKSVVSRLRYGKRNSKTNANDRLEMDIHALDLTLKQKKRINDVLDELMKEGGEALTQAAAESHFALTPHLVYRYLVSVDWADRYNGKRFARAIQDTVHWRRSFGLNTTNTQAVQHPRIVELVRRGFAYVAPVPDKDGRAVVYLKVARNFRKGAVPDFLNLLMYTMERADKQSVAFQSGEFISIMDLDGLTYAQCPPVSFLKQAISLLKLHYPYRLSAVYVVNAGGAFNMLYNMMKPILPKKALAKTYVLKAEESNAFLVDTIGMGQLERRYGGEMEEYFHPINSTVADVYNYYGSGYWGSAYNGP